MASTRPLPTVLLCLLWESTATNTLKNFILHRVGDDDESCVNSHTHTHTDSLTHTHTHSCIFFDILTIKNFTKILKWNFARQHEKRRLPFYTLLLPLFKGGSEALFRTLVEVMCIVKRALFNWFRLNQSLLTHKLIAFRGSCARGIPRTLNFMEASTH